MSNKSTGKSPFKVVCTKPPNHALHLVPLPKLPGLTLEGENMAKLVQQMKEDVRLNLDKQMISTRQR
jgi:hypothetical protein